MSLCSSWSSSAGSGEGSRATSPPPRCGCSVPQVSASLPWAPWRLGAGGWRCPCAGWGRPGAPRGPWGDGGLRTRDLCAPRSEGNWGDSALQAGCGAGRSGQGTLWEPARHGHASVSPLCKSTKRRCDNSGSIFWLHRLFWKVSSTRSGGEEWKGMSCGGHWGPRRR